MKTKNIITKILFVFSFFFFINTNAQAPDKMSYQAVIRNSTNQLISNEPVGMKISILQESADGTPQYVETQTATTNSNGLLSLQIGTGTVVSGSFSNIDWSAGNYFIKTETDPTGGTNYTITGTSQLLSVPYALNAKIATTSQHTNAINGSENYIPRLGTNNTIENSVIFNETESGNVGIHNDSPLVGLDVAGNGIILARRRVVLGPVGGDPAKNPIWAIDNYNNEFRIFNQPDIFSDGKTYLSVAPSGNINMTNNLNVSGDIVTNKISAGNLSNLGEFSSVGNNFTVTGSQFENLTVLHLTDGNIINYDVNDADRNIMVIHDDAIYGRYRINLPTGQRNGRVLDITLILNDNDYSNNRKLVEFTNLLPKPIRASFQAFAKDTVADGISMGFSYNVDDGALSTTYFRTSLTSISLIYSTELNTWVVKNSNYASSTYTF